MTKTGLAFSLSILGSVATAQTWQTQYLSYTVEGIDNPPLAIVVNKGEHEFAEAYIRTNTGRGLYIGCDPTVGGPAPDLAFGQIGDNAFMGAAGALTATFDDRVEVPINDLTYANGRYWSQVSTQILASLTEFDHVRVETAKGETVIDVPLTGAAQAIAMLDCTSMRGV